MVIVRKLIEQSNIRGFKMEHKIGHEVCDLCECVREYHALVANVDDQIVWYECGHVLVIKGGAVTIVHNYAE